MADIKWSAFPSIGSLATGDVLVGLRSGANVRFSALTIPWTVANGGTGLSTLTAYTLLAGGTTATGNLQQVSAGTAGQLLQSNGSGVLPSWTTATFPATAGAAGTILRSNGTNWVNSTSTFTDTYGASTLLYSNGANTVTGLATANSAALVTNSSGVPGWSSTMTNGQLIIGSTGATPAAATLTAGTNITVTNGAGSITLAASTAVSSITNIVTAAGTTTLTSSSTQIQRFTGSTTQICVLPDAGTLTVGQTFKIINESTGAVTVKTADTVLFVTVAANSTLTAICNTASGTTSSSWSYQYLPSTSGITGTGSTVRATSPTLVTPSLGVATATSINFGGTALATYSDSSFTPVLNFGGANTGITYSVQTGLYSRIGNIVTFYVIVILTSKGSATGNATVTGFPFAPRSSGNPAFSLFLENVTFTNTPICFLSGTTMQLKQLNSAAGASYLTDASFTNTSDFIITGSYLV